MTEFKIGAGTSEDQLQQYFAYLFAQSTTGTATTGVLTGLSVVQTATASANVLVNIGAAVSQTSLTAGAEVMLNNAQKSLDVLTSNPMGAVARNDLVVFNPATAAIELVVGTPNVTPTDPTPPTGSVLLARLAHTASATTVPTSRITDLRTITYPFGSRLPAVRAVRSTLVNTSVGSEVSIVTAPNVPGDGARRFKVSLSWFSAHTSVDVTTAELRLYRGSTLVKAARIVPNLGGSGVMGGSIFATDVPPAGPAVYVFKLVRVAGTGVVTINPDIELLVEHVA